MSPWAGVTPMATFSQQSENRLTNLYSFQRLSGPYASGSPGSAQSSPCLFPPQPSFHYVFSSFILSAHQHTYEHTTRTQTLAIPRLHRDATACAPVLRGLAPCVCVCVAAPQLHIAFVCVLRRPLGSAVESIFIGPRPHRRPPPSTDFPRSSVSVCVLERVFCACTAPKPPHNNIHPARTLAATTTICSPSSTASTTTTTTPSAKVKQSSTANSESSRVATCDFRCQTGAPLKRNAQCSCVVVGQRWRRRTCACVYGHAFRASET